MFSAQDCKASTWLPCPNIELYKKIEVAIFFSFVDEQTLKIHIVRGEGK